MLRSELQRLAKLTLGSTFVLALHAPTSAEQAYYECVYGPWCCGQKVTVVDENACWGGRGGISCGEYLQQYIQDRARICSLLRESSGEVCPGLAEVCGDCSRVDQERIQEALKRYREAQTHARNEWATVGNQLSQIHGLYIDILNRNAEAAGAMLSGEVISWIPEMLGDPHLQLVYREIRAIQSNSRGEHVEATAERFRAVLEYLAALKVVTAEFSRDVLRELLRWHRVTKDLVPTIGQGVLDRRDIERISGELEGDIANARNALMKAQDKFDLYEDIKARWCPQGVPAHLDEEWDPIIDEQAMKNLEESLRTLHFLAGSIGPEYGRVLRNLKQAFDLIETTLQFDQPMRSSVVPAAQFRIVRTASIAGDAAPAGFRAGLSHLAETYGGIGDFVVKLDDLKSELLKFERFARSVWMQPPPNLLVNTSYEIDQVWKVVSLKSQILTLELQLALQRGALAEDERPSESELAQVQTALESSKRELAAEDVMRAEQVERRFAKLVSELDARTEELAAKSQLIDSKQIELESAKRKGDSEQAQILSSELSVLAAEVRAGMEWWENKRRESASLKAQLKHLRKEFIQQ